MSTTLTKTDAYRLLDPNRALLRDIRDALREDVRRKGKQRVKQVRVAR